LPKALKITVIFLCALFMFTGCKINGTSAPQAVKLGAFLGLSGNIAGYGQSQKKGIDLAVAEVNSSRLSGSRREFQVLIIDTGASAEGAAAAITRLVQLEKVVGIIGPTLSAQAFAADPTAQQSRIPVIGISNTVPKITEMGDYIFRCSLPESSVISGTVKAASEILKVKKIGILWQKEDTLSAAGHEAFLAASQARGVQVIADETFLKGDVDFKPRLSRILAQPPDAVAALALINEASQITLQARELGFTGHILGGNGFNSPEIIKKAGPAAEGIVVGTAWNKMNNNPANIKFVADYQKAYDSPPDQFAAQAYTSILIYARAIREANSAQPGDIREALLKIRDLDTPLGPFSFSADREPVHPATVQVVREGEFTILNP
jgi:branched-chain amino acid transport system substrate-binding protein